MKAQKKQQSASAIQASHEAIAQLAHSFYEHGGRQDGRDWENWFRAEKVLNGQGSAGKPTHEEIAEVAYSFFQERGARHGLDVVDWLRAVAHVSTDEKHTQSAGC